MSTSIFEQVTSSLTVMSICGLLGPDIYEGTPLSELENELDPDENRDFDPISNPLCVIDSNGNYVGILWFSDYAQWEEEEDQEIFFISDVMTGS